MKSMIKILNEISQQFLNKVVEKKDKPNTNFDWSVSPPFKPEIKRDVKNPNINK